MTIEIRDAVEADLPAVLDIHNRAVAATTAIFSHHPATLDDRRSLLEDRRRRGFPFLVAAEGGDLLGYASFGPFRPHDGYALTVEHSIYVAEAHRRRGVATLLLPALVERARALGLHAMVGGLDAANAGSIALHERFGFERRGTLPAVAHKFGRWLDLLWVCRVLDVADPPGAPRRDPGGTAP